MFLFSFVYDYAYIFYILILFLLCITFLSPVIEGSQRWIVLGKIYFQPSELGKIIYIIGLSRLFNDYRIKNKFSLFFIFLIFISMVPPLIIFKQPDLGTAIIYLSLIPISYFQYKKINKKVVVDKKENEDLEDIL